MMIQSLINTVQLSLVLGTVLTLGFLFCLSHRDSQLGKYLVPSMSWGIAVFAALYCLSPIDLVPEALCGIPLGIFDDMAVFAVGVTAARSAMTARKAKTQNTNGHRLKGDTDFTVN